VDGSNPHSGSYAAYFGGLFDRDDIYQNVPTIPGHTYHISYWVANGFTVGGYTEIRSSWGGTVLEDLFPNNAFPYQQHTFDVVATSTSTEFRIGGSQGVAYWYLDDVSVTDTTTSGTFRVAKNTHIAKGNIVADTVFAAAAPHPMTADGGGSPGRARPPHAKSFLLDVATLLSPAFPSRASFSSPTSASTPSKGKLLGQEVAVADRLFASFNKGNAAITFSQSLRHQRAEADSWAIDPLRGDEPRFV
jgi:hypothetical protein